MFELRPFQKEAIDVLESDSRQFKHVICVAPTGSGKSLIYERYASRKGIKTLLITPLVALARQQYQRLRSLQVPAFLGAGGLGQKPRASESGAWIMSPEMLQISSYRICLERWRPEFLVVDECHCLWEWGEDFRPAFKSIPQILEIKSIQRSLWLTATLPLDARMHLKALLPSAPAEIGEFDLPAALHVSVRQVPLSDRPQALMQWLSTQLGAGIVFVGTRESTVRISRLIEALGRKTLIYHGGMSREERQNVEDLVKAQAHPKGVVVATSAFGMGMDYAHLSFVVLWQAPTSILSMVQTMGRVGRGSSASGHALVLWDRDDFRLIEWTVQNSEKRREELTKVLEFLSSSECRRMALKRYFDSITSRNKCHHCDQCNNGSCYP